MAEIFRNQTEVRTYIERIEEPRVRLLTEAALNRAIGAWLSDPELQRRLLTEPIDLLAFAKGVRAFFQNADILEGIVTGKYKTMSDLSEVVF